MKRNKSPFLILLFLSVGTLILASYPVSSGGLSMWPGKLTITMSDDFPEEEIRYEIKVTNLNTYDLNVAGVAENPILHRLNEEYTIIPDLSWVQITPDVVHIPAKESRFLEVAINVPDEEKSLHYDNRWEVWIVISEVNEQSTENMPFIQTELAAKFFIITPPTKTMLQPPQFLYLILFLIIGLITAYIFFVKKHRKTTRQDIQSVFYFKEKKCIKKSDREK